MFNGLFQEFVSTMMQPQKYFRILTFREIKAAKKIRDVLCVYHAVIYWHWIGIKYTVKPPIKKLVS